MEPKKHWLRWTQTSRHFPKNKYGFSQHLRKLGDHVITYPMPTADYIRIKDAAKFWAWRHDKRIRTRTRRVGPGMYEVTVTLIAHTRNPDV